MKIDTHVSKADLHGHTVNSDGELTVLELVMEAKRNGLDYYAITDHDCFDGADEAMDKNMSHEFGINIIYGLELSTFSNDESIHVLGYFKNKLEKCKLREVLKNQVEQRKVRANKIFDLLEEHFGIELDRSKVDMRNSITRGTIATLITDAGYNYSRKEIFDKMLGEGCPCYIPSSKMTTKEGIDLIHECGGIAVLAHPCLYTKNNVKELIELGVDGIEAIYPKTDNEETKYRDLAKKYNLVVTAGSDFHMRNDYKHGQVGSCTIKGLEIEKFLDRLNNR